MPVRRAEERERRVACGSPEDIVEKVWASIEAGAAPVALWTASYDRKGQFERVTREVLPALESAFAR